LRARAFTTSVQLTRAAVRALAREQRRQRAAAGQRCAADSAIAATTRGGNEPTTRASAHGSAVAAGCRGRSPRTRAPATHAHFDPRIGSMPSLLPSASGKLHLCAIRSSACEMARGSRLSCNCSPTRDCPTTDRNRRVLEEPNATVQSAYRALESPSHNDLCCQTPASICRRRCIVIRAPIYDPPTPVTLVAATTVAAVSGTVARICSTAKPALAPCVLRTNRTCKRKPVGSDPICFHCFSCCASSSRDGRSQQ